LKPTPEMPEQAQ